VMKARTRRLLGVLAAVVGAAACTATDAQPSGPAAQGWDDGTRLRWYGSSQGSRLIPLDWLMALEQPGSERLFLDDEHMAGFRYLPRPDASLSVGFAVDKQDDSRLSRTRLRWKAGQGREEPWVGMNCSACHTAELAYAGQRFRIDGGPTLADFQGFMEGLNLSYSQTLADQAKWDRFAARVLRGADDTRDNRNRLRRAFARLASWQAEQLRMNRTPLRYGYGRLDAFGHIYNKVALIAVRSPRDATPNPADAPVSYPFLWNIHQLKHVQYNSVVENKPVRSPVSGATFDIGALGRNTGEVIGVFADVVVPRNIRRLDGFESSVDINNLVGLEQQLERLEPPKWPAGLPPIDEGLAAEGEALFRTNCASCHLPLRAGDLATRVPDRISFFNDASQPAPEPGDTPPRNSPPLTDPWMACNAYTYQSASGAMQGLPSDYVSGAPLGRIANLSSMLDIAVLGTLAGKGGRW
jgi:cytochrome c2